jgi:BON domain
MAPARLMPEIEPAQWDSIRAKTNLSNQTNINMRSTHSDNSRLASPGSGKAAGLAGWIIGLAMALLQQPAAAGQPALVEMAPRILSANELLGHELRAWNVDGQKVGKIKDALYDSASGQLLAWLAAPTHSSQFTLVPAKMCIPTVIAELPVLIARCTAPGFNAAPRLSKESVLAGLNTASLVDSYRYFGQCMPAYIGTAGGKLTSARKTHNAELAQPQIAVVVYAPYGAQTSPGPFLGQTATGARSTTPSGVAIPSPVGRTDAEIFRSYLAEITHMMPAPGSRDHHAALGDGTISVAPASHAGTVEVFNSNINASVRGGRITLTGEAGNEIQKLRIAAAAARVVGSNNVDDQMTSR